MAQPPRTGIIILLLLDIRTIVLKMPATCTWYMRVCVIKIGLYPKIDFGFPFKSVQDSMKKSTLKKKRTHRHWGFVQHGALKRQGCPFGFPLTTNQKGGASTILRNTHLPNGFGVGLPLNKTRGICNNTYRSPWRLL